jgi:tRNA pseudouridine38-40 synthase
VKRNILLKLAYDGTAYCGWQRQEEGTPTVQQTVEEALERVVKHPVTVYGCSRTDSGVHAREFVLHFHTDCTIPCDRVPVAVNTYLPEDVVCFEAREMPDVFHARFDCAGKEYVYQILRSRYRDPMWHHRAYHYPYPLDLQAMREGAAHIRGKRDYAAFAAQGNPVHSTVRTVYGVEVQEEGELLRVYVRGDGFLYNMVRIIAGTLLLMGRGKLTVEELEAGLQAGDRTRMGPTVPPHGLYLNKVYYQMDGEKEG